ncbi:MAG: KOW motif domain-containing protein [Candidatus Dojkabacteria bacterium]
MTAKNSKTKNEKAKSVKAKDSNAKTSKAKESKSKSSKLSKNLRKGDLVEVRSGKYKGKSGKVISVNKKNNRVYIEGVAELTDFNNVDESGSRSVVKKNVGVHISNVKLNK